MSVAELDTKSFAAAIADKTPVIIDFWADWCMPCRMMAPVFAELSENYGQKLRFAKLHTVDFPELSEKHKIDGIPCCVMFKSGKEKGRIIGFMSKPQLKDKIDALLK